MSQTPEDEPVVCGQCERLIPEDAGVYEINAKGRDKNGKEVFSLTKEVCEDCARQAVIDTIALRDGGLRG